MLYWKKRDNQKSLLDLSEKSLACCNIDCKYLHFARCKKLVVGHFAIGSIEVAKRNWSSFVEEQFAGTRKQAFDVQADWFACMTIDFDSTEPARC